MTEHEHVAEDRERLRIYVTGTCDGLAEVLQALQAHDELELVGASESIQEAASALAGGHLDRPTPPRSWRRCASTVVRR